MNNLSRQESNTSVTKELPSKSQPANRQHGQTGVFLQRGSDLREDSQSVAKRVIAVHSSCEFACSVPIPIIGALLSIQLAFFGVSTLTFTPHAASLSSNIFNQCTNILFALPPFPRSRPLWRGDFSEQGHSCRILNADIHNLHVSPVSPKSLVANRKQ